MAEGLVTALEVSASYERTRRLVTLLKVLPHITPEQLDRLWNAARDNDQVSKANLRVGRGFVSAPALIDDLIVQHGGRVPVAVASDEPPF
jgi:hypothetical protein